MKIINKTKNIVLAEEAGVADNPFRRIKGLLGKKGLNRGEALVIRPCNSIHTFFMRFPIDVLFVSKDNRVVKAISCLKSFRLSAVYFSASFVIELPSGVIQSTSTQEGDSISLQY
ncbi:MAG: DUF192 domain-containing protein [Candidatus Omnitrophica bacterium]|nr:DUF192 domain-containing protein [Candidatus Omnitrophota bacterium]